MRERERERCTPVIPCSQRCNNKSPQKWGPQYIYIYFYKHKQKIELPFSLFIFMASYLKNVNTIMGGNGAQDDQPWHPHLSGECLETTLPHPPFYGVSLSSSTKGIPCRAYDRSASSCMHCARLLFSLRQREGSGVVSPCASITFIHKDEYRRRQIVPTSRSIALVVSGTHEEHSRVQDTRTRRSIRAVQRARPSTRACLVPRLDEHRFG